MRLAVLTLLTGCMSASQPLMMGPQIVMSGQTMATNSTPITIHIDGEPVATLADPGVVYDHSANAVHIHTEQGLHCQAVTVFHDRFEGVDQ